MAGLGALGAGGLFAGKSLAVLGAGLLAGAVGGSALVATGTVEFGGSGDGVGAPRGAGLELVPCPDQGPIIGTIPPNQKVLITAKSADGTWLQLYWPAPGIERAWTKAGPLQLEGSLASLPVAACEAPATPSPRPTVEPTPSPEPTPTPTPVIQPTTEPTPTAAAASAPRVSGLAASTRSVSYDQGGYCAGDPASVTFSVNATDADGIADVTLFFRRPGTTKYAQKPMTRSGGTYVATLNTTTDKLQTGGQLAYYVVARDRAGTQRSTKSPRSGALSLTVKVCKNTGPSITFLKASPTSIIADPLGAGCSGATLSELQARATDSDGVKSIRLYFKKPGSGTYSSRLFTRDGGTWYSSINTVPSVDSIVRSGTVSWYAVATDEKGATTKSSVRSIKVTRCDSEANQFWVSEAGLQFSIPSNATCAPRPPTAFTLTFMFRDRDGPAKTGVTIDWTLAGTKRTVKAVRTGLDGDVGVYEAAVPTSEWDTIFKAGARSYMTVVIHAGDTYGGRTNSPALTGGLFYRCQ